MGEIPHEGRTKGLAESQFDSGVTVSKLRAAWGPQKSLPCAPRSKGRSTGDDEEV